MQCSKAALLDHLVNTGEQRRRNFESDALCGPQVDYQLELRRLNDRQIGGLGAFEDATRVNPNQPVRLGVAWSVASQATGLGGLAKVIESRDPMVIGERYDLIAPADQTNRGPAGARQAAPAPWPQTQNRFPPRWRRSTPRFADPDCALPSARPANAARAPDSSGLTVGRS